MAHAAQKYLPALLKQANKLGVLYEDRSTDTDGNLVVRTMQDVEPILKHNKDLQIHGGKDVGISPTREMRHVAHIPMWLAHKWIKEGIHPWTHEGMETIRKKLNSNEFEWLRISKGVV